jgi:hypothetical protein
VAAKRQPNVQIHKQKPPANKRFETLKSHRTSPMLTKRVPTRSNIPQVLQALHQTHQ